jgi:hypothetical protein
MIAKLDFAIGSSAGESGATVMLQLEDARYVEVEVGVFPSPRATMTAMSYHYAWRPGLALRPLLPDETYARPSEPLEDYALLYCSRDFWDARWVFGNALVHVASYQVDVWAGALAIQRFLSTAGIEHAPPAPPQFRLEPARVQPGDRFEMRLTIPSELGPEQEVLMELRDRVRAVEADRTRERQRTGGRVLGRRAVLAQSWRSQPTSHEPRRNLRPRGGTESVGANRGATAQPRLIVAYTNARERWRAGTPVLFPPGTYWLRRFAQVPVAET